MEPEDKERILRALKEKSPEVLGKIQVNLFSFEDIATLEPKGIQALVNSVEQKDLVLALKNAPENVREVLLENMSQRKKSVTIDDLNNLPPTRLADVKAAQKKILEVLDTLRTGGLVRTQGKNDVWV